MNEDLKTLIALVEEYMSNVDTEMEHGCYETPSEVPRQYEDEDDYYAEHEKITDATADSRQAIKDFIMGLRERV